MANTKLPLNTGGTIPQLGFGVWQSSKGEVKKAVAHALKAGYRHIDCAYMYGNTAEVGEALVEAYAAGTVKREDIFITTKLWCTFHSRVAENLELELKSLQTDYVDLYLMHWPCPMNPNGNHPTIPKLPDGSRDLDRDWHFSKTWELMEQLPTSKARAIGVANFSQPFMETLLRTAKKVPAVNQIENHPYLPQQEVVDYCRSKGIHITAYSPLGSTGSPLMQEAEVKQVADKHGVSPVTVLVSYHLPRGSSVLVKSVTPKRIEDNLHVVQLDAEDMKLLEGVSKSKGTQRFVYPDFGVNFGFPDKTKGLVYEGVPIESSA